ncbi:MAG: RsmB/NOP family class I SAM-dependent RNA methyltransferase [Lachnospiraceae bacterium]|nr:RsmB/NOP family class I SAM-dependent RNA methyltransferase [Lachnospiraceae bacterium]
MKEYMSIEKATLPSAFLTRMRGQLQDEAEPFFACYEKEAEAGIRMNTLKISLEEASGRLPFARQRIPWTDNGFYLDADAQASRHPWYRPGLYYMPEPSAKLPARILPVEPGNMVLDLCAAPGGKSTELLSRLKGEGLLIANDVSASRAKALVKNLALWGAANACITSETPQRLLDAFGCCFDRILVDAPCSGEGMFRKEHSLIASWQKKGPAQYAPLQKESLSCAVQMLKPGGMLLYSTCTFSEEEDEEVVADALARYPELSLIQGPEGVVAQEGFLPGRTPASAPEGVTGVERCVRLYPHRVRGEGHFAALLQKRVADDRKEISHEVWDAHTPQSEIGGRTRLGNIPPDSHMPEPVRDFIMRIAERSPVFSDIVRRYRYEQISDQCLLLPPYHLPRGIRYLRTGVRAGVLKNGRFEPSQELALLMNASDYDTVLGLSAEDPRTLRYLKGETIEWNDSEISRCETNSHKGTGRTGWALICVDGYGLGWGKLMDGTIRNKYYPGWRML